MTAPAASYKKVFYDLRPAKQVERRMLIDTLHLLAEGGFRIRDYQYTGFGSVSFVDFILLHRLVGLQRLLSVEHDLTIRKRIEFNRPFDQVDVRMEQIGTVIPDLDRDLKHILWLDYDFLLRKSALDDTALAATRLSPGSILVVTLDVEPPNNEGPETWYDYFKEEAGDRLPFELGPGDFGLSKLPQIVGQIVFNAIRSGMAGRTNLAFFPLFNFVYKDGHQMVTVGGMFGTTTEKAMLDGCDFRSAHFLRTSVTDTPYEIRVPRLTRRERIYMDHHMPCVAGWTPPDFELSAQDVDDYLSVYRYYPGYAELLL
jgi:hypothetical protein